MANTPTRPDATAQARQLAERTVAELSYLIPPTSTLADMVTEAFAHNIAAALRKAEEGCACTRGTVSTGGASHDESR